MIDILKDELEELERLLNKLDPKNPEDNKDIDRIHRYLTSLLKEIHSEEEDNEDV